MAKHFDIFLSYAAADHALAASVADRLTAAGFTVVAPSDEYTPTAPSRSLDILSDSSMAVYIASRHSNALKKSVNEILEAARTCKALFIVVTDDSSFPTAIPRPTVYKLPTIDFRRQLPLEVLLDRLAATVTQVAQTGSVYTPAQLDELRHIKAEAAEGRSLIAEGKPQEAVEKLADVVKRLEELPAYPPTQLAHAYSDLAEAHYRCQNYRRMYESDEHALALIAGEDFPASKDINYRLAVAVSRMDNPSHEQLCEALSHIEAAIYDNSMTAPSDRGEAVEMEHLRNEIVERLAI